MFKCELNDNLLNAINKLFYNMSILELQMQNEIDGELTYNDILYITLISIKNGELTSSMIADFLLVSKPSVTQKINSLEKKGYIVKKQSEKDRRIYYLYINEENEYFSKFNSINDNINNKILNKYNEKEIKIFCDILCFISDECM